MENLIAFIVAVLITLATMVGFYTNQQGVLQQQTNERLASQEAQDMVAMAQGLDSYVAANLASASAFATQPISAATMGIPAAQGVDALGEVLGGYVASPQGSPQSWFITPVAAGSLQGVTTASLLSDYGLANPVALQAWWGLVARDVAQLSAGQLQGYTYNAVNAAFIPPMVSQSTILAPGQASPLSGAGAWSSLAMYVPTTGVPYPATSAPAPYAPFQFSGVVSNTLSSTLGYWVWWLQLTNSSGLSSQSAVTATASLTSAGWSAACPSGGQAPLYSASFPFNFGAGVLPSGPFYNEQGPYLFSYSIFKGSGLNFDVVPVCIPMAGSTYYAVQHNGFSLSSACQASGQGCSAYTPPGAASPTGYITACAGTACANTNIQLGEGYSSANNSNAGESITQADWVTTTTTGGVFYLYGTDLFDLPGGVQFTLVWSSGVEANGVSGPTVNDGAALFAGNQTTQSFYTVPPVLPASSTSNYGAGTAWGFSVVGNTATPSDTTKNSNYTVIHLGG